MKKTRTFAYIVIGLSALVLICSCAALDHFFGYSAAAVGTGNTGALSPLPEGSPAAAAKEIIDSAAPIFGPGAAAISGLLGAIASGYFAIRKAQQKDQAGEEAHKENVAEICELKARIAFLEKTVASSGQA